MVVQEIESLRELLGVLEAAATEADAAARRLEAQGATVEPHEILMAIRLVASRPDFEVFIRVINEAIERRS